MVSNVRKSTICIRFDGKFANMRKEQNFVIYPISQNDEYMKIQSEGRFGLVDKNGRLVLTSKNANYSNYASLISEMRNKTAKGDLITPEEMEMIRNVLQKENMGNWLCAVAGNEGATTF
jgi:hypothetical protein